MTRYISATKAVVLREGDSRAELLIQMLAYARAREAPEIEPIENQ